MPLLNLRGSLPCWRLLWFIGIVAGETCNCFPPLEALSGAVEARPEEGGFHVQSRSNHPIPAACCVVSSAMGVYLQPPRAAALASVVWGVIDGFVSPEFLHTHHLHQLNNRTHYFKWPKYAALYALKFNLLILLPADSLFSFFIKKGMPAGE